ncbi:MAG: hypothetical protein LBK02_01075 [Treponema sp.]|jgi:23S rRNA (cytidine2498-2'-O)-methyltransferase|nr:hypothetical protein [Treponema sp.]
MTQSPLKGRVYQAVPGFEDHLRLELEAFHKTVEDESSRKEAPAGAWKDQWGALYYTEHTAGDIFWRQNLWLEPLLIEFDSISEAASALRAIQRNWQPEFFTQFRRGALITAKLPPISEKPRPFPWALPGAPVGAFTHMRLLNKVLKT